MHSKGALSAIKSVTFFGLLYFGFSAGFPPFDDATEVDLTLHMLQHVMIVVAGATIAYPLFRRRFAGVERVGLWLKAGLVAAALLIVFWHFSGPWDAAVLNPGVHVVEHLSFLAVGSLPVPGSSCSPTLRRSGRCWQRSSGTWATRSS